MSPISVEKSTANVSDAETSDISKSKNSNPNSPAVKNAKNSSSVNPPVAPSPAPSNHSNQQNQNSAPPPPTSQANIIKTVLLNLNNQRKLRQFTDTIIIVAGESFHLHRCLLAANSEYFVQLFKAAVPPNSVYVLLNVTKNAFEVIIEFIYTGGFSLKKENVHEVFHAAKLLGIGHVLNCCKKVMKEIGDSGNNNQNNANPVNPVNLLPKPVANNGFNSRNINLSTLSNLQAQLAGLAASSGNSNNNSILNNERALSLSMHNSLLPLEVQQVFLNQIANGKLGNGNTSKALRKDAAILAKQIEQQVKEQKSVNGGGNDEPEPLLTRKRKAGELEKLVSDKLSSSEKSVKAGVKEEWRPEEMYEDLVNGNSGEVENDDESNDVNVGENELHEELMKIAELRKRRKVLNKKD